MPIDQQMRISVAEHVVPDWYNSRADNATLRKQNAKLAATNRRLERELARLEAAAALTFGDGSVEDVRRAAYAESAKERDRQARAHKLEVGRLRDSLAVQIERADALARGRAELAEAAAQAAGVRTATKRHVEAMQRKLSDGKLLSEPEIRVLKAHGELAAAGGVNALGPIPAPVPIAKAESIASQMGEEEPHGLAAAVETLELRSLSEAKAQLTTLGVRNATLKHDNDELSAQLVGLQGALASLQTELTTRTGEVASLSRQLERERAACASLRAERDSLMGALEGKALVAPAAGAAPAE